MKTFRSLFFGILLVTSELFAHARLTSPVPRTMNAGIKTGPCGAAVTQTPTVYQAGQMIKVSWEETVNHPGFYTIYFSNSSGAAEAEFQTLVPRVNDVAGQSKYEAMVQLPNIACDRCTLRMIQWMADDPAVATPYFSCADISLRADTPAPTPTKTPVPASSPTPIDTSADHDHHSAVASSSEFGCETQLGASNPFKSELILLICLSMGWMITRRKSICVK